MKFIKQPAKNQRLGDFLKKELAQDWDSFRAAVAFVKSSGTRHIDSALRRFSSNSTVEIAVGVDHQVTSAEGLKSLFEAVQPNGKIFVYHNQLPHTFHPKIFLFSSGDKARAVIGSGNLTEGGLYTNYEAGILLDFDLSKDEQRDVVEEMNATLDEWMDVNSGTTIELDDDYLDKLIRANLVPSEKKTHSKAKISARKGSAKQLTLFDAAPVPKAPATKASAKKVSAAKATTPHTGAGKMVPAKFATKSSGISNFVMTLMQTDAGTGQKTVGAAKRSPEVFIPLVARDEHPDFWGWDRLFTLSKDKKQMSRNAVPILLHSTIIQINMMVWFERRDFRLRAAALRDAMGVGDILHLKKMPTKSPYEYHVNIIKVGTGQHAIFDKKCTESVKNSQKRYGYF